MNRFSKGLIAAGAALLMMSTGAASASANVKPAPTASAVIGGHLYGPKDGLVVDTQQFDVTPSRGQAGQISPMATVSPMLVYTWGTSYASTTESLQLLFTAKAKAGGNVYGTTRIIQVCVWYTRGTAQVGNKVCSNATSNGATWTAGAMQSTSVWDSLAYGAPKTTWHYSTYRIAPQIR